MAATRMSKKQLDFSVLNNSFSSTPHPYFVMYDEEADEFIIKIKKPDSPTALFYIQETIALIVSLHNNQVIGVTFFNFSNEHLPKVKGLNKRILTREFMHYQELKYEPKNDPGENVSEFLYKTNKVLREDLICV
jgi:hypothetical protein